MWSNCDDFDFFFWVLARGEIVDSVDDKGCPGGFFFVVLSGAFKRFFRSCNSVFNSSRTPALVCGFCLADRFAGFEVADGNIPCSSRLMAANSTDIRLRSVENPVLVVPPPP